VLERPLAAPTLREHAGLPSSRCGAVVVAQRRRRAKTWQRKFIALIAHGHVIRRILVLVHHAG
jgi:hypothetical protein